MPTTFEEGAAYAAGGIITWLLLALLIGSRYAGRLGTSTSGPSPAAAHDEASSPAARH